MSEENKRYYFNFSFFKIDPKWRWMADLAKEESAKELENILENAPVQSRTYSTLGLRNDADFLIWFMSESIEDIQETISKIYLTVVGKYIMPSIVYFSSTRPSIYAQKDRIHSFVGGLEAKKIHSCLSLYQNKKMVSPYLLDNAKAMMDEHIKS
jgi:Uncharacterized conserved protein